MFLIEKKLFLSTQTKFKSKNLSFPNRLTHAFGQKLQIFLYLDLVKIKLEKMLNSFLEKQETFFDNKNKNFSVPKIAFFQRG